MTTHRHFKPITGVPASDAEIDAFAARRGIPALTAVANAPASLPRETPAKPPSSRFNIDIPEYLAEALRIRAIKERCSTRHLFMLALKASGYAIDDTDMQPDGRRLRT